MIRQCKHCGRKFTSHQGRHVYCRPQCKEKARKRPVHGKGKINSAAKAGSQRIAIELVRDARISMEMAVECLKLSGHSTEEIEKWKRRRQGMLILRASH